MRSLERSPPIDGQPFAEYFDEMETRLKFSHVMRVLHSVTAQSPRPLLAGPSVSDRALAPELVAPTASTPYPYSVFLFEFLASILPRQSQDP
jgi:hypothetical protein